MGGGSNLQIHFLKGFTVSSNAKRLMGIIIALVAAFFGAGFYMSSIDRLASLFGNFYNPSFVLYFFAVEKGVDQLKITYVIAFVIIFVVLAILIDKFMINSKDSKK